MIDHNYYKMQDAGRMCVMSYKFCIVLDAMISLTRHIFARFSLDGIAFYKMFLSNQEAFLISFVLY